jgi:hypothetical protein
MPLEKRPELDALLGEPQLALVSQSSKHQQLHRRKSPLIIRILMALPKSEPLL